MLDATSKRVTAGPLHANRSVPTIRNHPRNMVLVSLALAWMIMAPVVGTSGYAQDATETLRESLEAIRSKHSLPGLIAGYFPLEGEVQMAAVGTRKAWGDDPLLVDDPMHLGSCTKSMTATLIGILVDEGKLTFETRLSEIFADDPLVVNSEWADTTVDQLLRHTSGAVANPPWVRFSSSDTDVVEHRRNVLHWLVGRRRKPDSVGKFVYSNLGYTVLGHILEKIRGRPWEVEIRERLFEPLGIQSAGFGAPSKSIQAATPWGHTSVLGFLVATEDDNPPSLGPAGTVYMRMADWVKYLRVHLMTDPAATGVLPISASTLARLHQANEGETYAAGWICGERDWAGGRILVHNGSNTHWFCVVFLALDQRRGFFAASNNGLAAIKPCDLAIQALIKQFPAPEPVSKPNEK